ncbi:MAG: ribosomal protein large subunit ribosomal protein [Parcubacteria group bacterium]|nr:ribosomal protein large subunit ribosomal protein [Parcubacteria group bacterium]
MAVKTIKTNKGGPVQPGEHKMYIIDATGKSLGRVASEAASIILGKKSVNYVQNEVLPVEVTIENAGALKMTEKRIAMKEYYSYTGYPGGLRTQSMQMMIDKKGISEVLYTAVDGMIPRNKLRKERMKRLTIKD